MNTIETTLTAGNQQARKQLLAGTIAQLPATAASLRLVDDVKTVLAKELGNPSDLRLAERSMAGEDFFAAVGRVRKVLFTTEHFHALTRSVVGALGFDAKHIAFDPMRLRAINHLGHENPRAAPVYYAHRDTWYAHPQAIIAWWIPLDDLDAEETFEFYPDYLHRAVANGSIEFEYKAWVEDGWDLRIGWQDRDAGLTAEYPKATPRPSSGAPSLPSELHAEPRWGSGLGFDCKLGDNLLFAGAHLHRTLPQAKGRSRFSLDFRIVDLRDHHAGLGAPNTDNRSRGSALVDYVKPAPGSETAGSVARSP